MFEGVKGFGEGEEEEEEGRACVRDDEKRDDGDVRDGKRWGEYDEGGCMGDQKG